MLRNTVFASLIALGAAGAAAAQAADNGPQLVNRNGSQEVVYGDARTGNIVGGAYATITGGGDNAVYRAAPGAHTEEPALVGRLSGGGDNEVITYSPARPGASG